MEAARSERIRAGSRGDRAGNAAHSARTRGRRAVRGLCVACAGGALCYEGGQFSLRFDGGLTEPGGVQVPGWFKVSRYYDPACIQFGWAV